MKSTKFIQFCIGFALVAVMSTLAFGAVSMAVGSELPLQIGVPCALGVKTLSYIVPSFEWNLPSNGMAFDAFSVTIFSREIEKKLYPENAFYRASQDHSAFIDGATVKYPVQGANPAVSINRGTFPATIGAFTDETNSWDLKSFTSDPQVVRDFEQQVRNYAVVQNLAAQHGDAIEEKIGDYFANIWLPEGSGTFHKTTGDNRDAADYLGMTGTRKAVTENDLIKIAEIFTRMNVPVKGRYCVLPPDMQADIQKIPGFKSSDEIATKLAYDGWIGSVKGFDIFVRSMVGLYTNAATPVKKAMGATVTATDMLAALFYHDKFVTRAIGGTKTFINRDKAEYYGTVISAEKFAGGKIRQDKKGVMALVQAVGV